MDQGNRKVIGGRWHHCCRICNDLLSFEEERRKGTVQYGRTGRYVRTRSSVSVRAKKLLHIETWIIYAHFRRCQVYKLSVETVKDEG